MIYVFTFIVLTIISQVLLKQASIKNSKLKTGYYLLYMFKTPKVFFAYFLSFLNIFIWIIALNKTSLIIAFFSTSSIYVIMIFVGHFILNESINVVKIVGALIITIGVILNLI